jgi:hypothetical protein
MSDPGFFDLERRLQALSAKGDPLLDVAEIYLIGEPGLIQRCVVMMKLA